MFKVSSLALLTLVLSTQAIADVASVKLGISAWQPGLSGVTQDGVTAVDLENDLNLDDDKATQFSIALEHPVPVLPNIKLVYNDLSISADSTLTRSFDFDGSVFSISEDVRTDADLTHYDGTLYYEILDNTFSLDLGVTVRLFDGFVSIQSDNQFAEAELDDPIPLLYGKVQFDLPLSGLALSADVNGLGYNGDSVVDYVARLSYTTDLGFGVEVGYRGFKVDADEIGDFLVDADFSGPFAGLTFKF